MDDQIDDMKQVETLDPSQKLAQRQAQRAARGSAMQRLDAWMAQHPWHPRVFPFVVYVALLWASEPARMWAPWAFPAVYTLQCVVTAWLLWRYRKLTPELNWKFHWLAIPAGLVGLVGWIWLGDLMAKLWFDDAGTDVLAEMGPALGWTTLSLRLVGMSLVVPMFEELFFRSALLRSLYEPKPALAALIDLLSDLPIVGDWIGGTKAGRWAGQYERPMQAQFEKVPVGRISGFSLAATCILWCVLSHAPRDWPGTFVCGFAWGGLVWATNRGQKKLGIGPVVWAHAITNAMLWGYVVYTGDWRFL